MLLEKQVTPYICILAYGLYPERDRIYYKSVVFLAHGTDSGRYQKVKLYTSTTSLCSNSKLLENLSIRVQTLLALTFQQTNKIKIT